MSETYPMCKPQSVQLDCREELCRFHENGSCKNTAPAITLVNGKYTCWSKKGIEDDRRRESFWNEINKAIRDENGTMEPCNCEQALRYKKALEDIKEHIKIVIPTDTHFSDVWNIANQALKGEE